jgi:tRNA-specific adenosine deaminase 1
VNGQHGQRTIASSNHGIQRYSSPSLINAGTITNDSTSVAPWDAEASPSPSLICAALATGMKCLPQAKIAQAQGNVLHDWHAEVLAMRGFNRWILEECAELATAGRNGRGEWVDWKCVQNSDDTGDLERNSEVDQEVSDTVRAFAEQPFKLRDDVSIHMYVSQAPCGDASMELTMAAQDSVVPWTHAAPSASPDDMLGRGHFDQLGIVRRKPGRPDAPVTLSKSCSDKLALKQITSLLSGLAATLVWPGNMYLSSLVLPEKEAVPEALERAFGLNGRMRSVAAIKERCGYTFRPFIVRTTSRTFAYVKSGEGAVGSNLSALYTPRRQEILINGALQGRKQFDPKGASCVSRRRMWMLTCEVAAVAGLPALGLMLNRKSYGDMKEQVKHKREEMKNVAKEKALQGWRRNDGDEDWHLEDYWG